MGAATLDTVAKLRIYLNSPAAGERLPPPATTVPQVSQDAALLQHTQSLITRGNMLVGRGATEGAIAVFKSARTGVCQRFSDERMRLAVEAIIEERMSVAMSLARRETSSEDIKAEPCKQPSRRGSKGSFRSSFRKGTASSRKGSCATELSETTPEPLSIGKMHDCERLADAPASNVRPRSFMGKILRVRKKELNTIAGM